MNLAIFLPIAILWIIFGFQHYIYWPFAIFYGYNLFVIAERLQIHYAILTLINNEYVFNHVIEKKLKMIEHNATDTENL